MGNSRKNDESRFGGLETFSEFSHIIKILVNALMPPANQTHRSIPCRVLLQNNNLNSRKSIHCLRAIFQESEAKLEMKIFNPPSFFLVGYLEG